MATKPEDKMSINEAIEIIRGRNGRPHEDDWDLADASLVALNEIDDLKAIVNQLQSEPGILIPRELKATKARVDRLEFEIESIQEQINRLCGSRD